MERTGIRILIGLILFSIVTFGPGARAQVSLPTDFTVEGRLYDKNTGLPLNTNTTITLQLLDKDSGCILYAEDHTGVVLGSSSGNADGLFALRLGTGVRTFPGAPVNMASLFSNSFPLVGDGSVVPSCASITPGPHRSVRVIVGSETLSPDTILTAAPTATLAGTAETLQGFGPSDFVKINAGQGVTQSNVENVFQASNYAKLLSLLAGNYVSNSPAANVDLNYHNITNVSAPILAGDAVNKAYSDATVGGKTVNMTGVGIGVGGGNTLVWNATLGQWEVGSGGMGVTSIVAGNGLHGGTISTVGTVSVDTGTTAGKILQLDGNAQIPAVDGYLVSNINAMNLQSRAISAAAPSSGQILAWNSAVSMWEPTNSSISGITALTGDVLASGVGSVVATIANDSITAAKISTVGGGLNQLLITDNSTGSNVRFMTCALGEILQWTATGWGCVDISGALGPSGVAAGTYGDGTTVPQFTVDGQGRLTNVNATAINFPITTVAGRTGAVTLIPSDIVGLGSAALQAVGTSAGNVVQLDGAGKIPALDGSQLTNLNDLTLAGRAVDSAAPTGGTILTWNGVISKWQALPAPSGNPGTVTLVSAGTGLQGGNIASAGTLSVDVGTGANQIVQLNGTAKLPAVDGYQLSNLNATRIGTRTIASTLPTAGQVLTWNSLNSQWEPVAPATSGTVTNVAAGTGLLGGSITNNGTLSVDVGTTANKILQLNASAQIPAVDGILLSNVNAVKLHSRDIASVAPTHSQVLAWNGLNTKWEPQSVLTTFPLQGPGGTAAAPTYALGGSDTGIYGAAGANISMSIGGYPYLTVGTTSMAVSVPVAMQIANNGTTYSSSGSASRPGLAEHVGINVSAVNNSGYQYAMSVRNSNGVDQDAYIGAISVGGASNYTPQIVIGQKTGANSYDERIRINASGNMGIGVSNPSAILHLRPGSVTASGAPLKLTSGPLLSTAEAGAIEYDGTNLYYTDGTNTRRTLANTGAGSVTIGAANQLAYYSGAGSTVSGLATTNSAVLTTTAGGAPAWALLSSDTFTQYALLSGRSGGQALSGGTAAFNSLTLDSTSHATKGKILLNPSGGNVGVGTPTPGAQLDVIGTMRVTTICDNAGLNCKTVNAGWTSGTLTSITAGTGLLGGTVTSTGTLNVDVGTSAFQVLQLDNNAQIPAVDGYLLTNVNAVKLQSRNIASVAPTSNQVLAWNSTSLQWEPQTILNGFPLQAPDSSPSAPTYSFSGSPTTGFYRASGTVGLALSGTTFLGFNTSSANFFYPVVNQSASVTNPYASSGSTARPLAMEHLGVNAGASTGASYMYSMSVKNSSSRVQNAYMGATSIAGGGYTPALVFGQQTAASTYIERMRITEAGNVGIGTDVPSANLEIKSSSGNPVYLAATNSDWSPGSLGSGIELSTLNSSGNTQSVIRSLNMGGSSPGPLLLNPNGGNIGINTVSPASELDVNGTLRVTTICDSSGANCKNINGGWNAGGTVTLVSAGSGLVGGNITTTGTLAVDVGTTAYKIVQMDSSGRLPAVDGSNLSNLNADRLRGRQVKNATPSNGQVLTWNTVANIWEFTSPSPDLPLIGGTITGNLTVIGNINVQSGGTISASGTNIINVASTTFSINSTHFGHMINYANAADGTITLPLLSSISNGFSVTITRSVYNNVFIVSHATDGAAGFANSTGTYEMGANNAASATFTKVNGKWILTAKSDDCTIGQACWGTGNIYIGLFNGHQYFTTTGNCTNATTCSGGMDTTALAWASNSGTSAYNVSTGQNDQTYGGTNTANLATNYTDTAAAKFCDSMTVGGYSDWYLPSIRELEFLARSTPVGFQHATGSYWSSTENGTTQAFYITPTLTSSAGARTNATYFVRCIRRF